NQVASEDRSGAVKALETAAEYIRRQSLTMDLISGQVAGGDQEGLKLVERAFSSDLACRLEKDGSFPEQMESALARARMTAAMLTETSCLEYEKEVEYSDDITALAERGFDVLCPVKGAQQLVSDDDDAFLIRRLKTGQTMYAKCRLSLQACRAKESESAAASLTGKMAGFADSILDSLEAKANGLMEGGLQRERDAEDGLEAETIRHDTLLQIAIMTEQMADLANFIGHALVETDTLDKARLAAAGGNPAQGGLSREREAALDSRAREAMKIFQQEAEALNMTRPDSFDGLIFSASASLQYLAKSYRSGDASGREDYAKEQQGERDALEMAVHRKKLSDLERSLNEPGLSKSNRESILAEIRQLSQAMKDRAHDIQSVNQELTAELLDLDRRIGELQASVQEAAQRRSQGQTTDRNIILSGLRGSLPEYIPTNAAGPIKKFEVNGKTIEGIGKTRIFFEDLRFSEKKLTDRIGRHVARFRAGRQITGETISQAMDAVVGASGLFGDKFAKKCRKAHLLETPDQGQERFQESSLGELGVRLNLIENLWKAREPEDIRKAVAAARAYIPQPGAGDLSYDNPFFHNNPKVGKIIILHRLLAETRTQGNKTLRDAGLGDELTGRLNAARDNTLTLYQDVIGSNEYKMEVLKEKRAKTQARLQENLSHYHSAPEDLTVRPSFDLVHDKDSLLQRIDHSVQQERLVQRDALNAEAYHEISLKRDEYRRQQAEKQNSARDRKRRAEQLRDSLEDIRLQRLDQQMEEIEGAGIELAEAKSLLGEGAEEVFRNSVKIWLTDNPEFKGCFGEGDEDMVLRIVREEIKRSRPGGILDGSPKELAKLSQEALSEYMNLLQYRFIPYREYMKKLPRTAALRHDENGRNSLMRKYLDEVRDFRTDALSKADEAIGDAAKTASEEAGVLKETYKKTVMSLGQSHSSRRAFVDLRKQRVSRTIGWDREFRQVRRMGRVREKGAQLKAFLDGHQKEMPLLYDDFAIRNGHKPEEATKESRTAYAAYLSSWAGADQDLQAWVKANLINGTSLRDDMDIFPSRELSVLYKGIGDRVSDTGRGDYEKKFKEVRRQYYRRADYIRKCCEKIHNPALEAELLETFRLRLTSSDEECRAEGRRNYDSSAQGGKAVKKEELDRIYLETGSRILEDRFHSDVDEIVRLMNPQKNRIATGSGDSRSERDESDEEYRARLEEQNRIRDLVTRKEDRITELENADQGIFAPLIPVLLGNKAFTDSLMADTDEDYETVKQRLLDNAGDVMRMLGEEGGVLYNIMDQILAEYGDRILDGTLWKETANCQPDQLRRELNSFYDSIMDTEIDGIIGKTKLGTEIGKRLKAVANPRDRKKARIAGKILAYQGPLAVMDPKKMDEYSRRLEANEEVFQDSLRTFMEQHEADFRDENGDLDQGLQKAFAKGFELEEFDNMLLMKTAAEAGALQGSYQDGLQRRLSDWLEIARKERVEEKARTARQAAIRQSLSQGDKSMLASKLRGREGFALQRKTFETERQYAYDRVSPLLSAGEDQRSPEEKARLQERRAAFERYISQYNRQARGEMGISDMALSAALDVMLYREAEKPDSVTSEVAHRIIVSCNTRYDKLLEEKKGRGPEAEKAAEGDLAFRTIFLAQTAFDTTGGKTDPFKNDGISPEEAAEAFKGLISLKEGLPADGILNSYYSQMVTHVSYELGRGELGAVVRDCTSMANLIVLNNSIDDYIAEFRKDVSGPESALVRNAFKTGAFEILSGWLLNSSVALTAGDARNELLLRYGRNSEEERQGQEGYQTAWRCTLDDSDMTGVMSHVSYDDIPGFMGQVSRQQFEKKLARYDVKDCVKEYMKLDDEAKRLIGHLLASSEIISSVDSCLGMSLVYSAQADTKASGSRSMLLARYISNRFSEKKHMGSDEPARIKEIGEPDYAQVERVLFSGGKLNLQELSNAITLFNQARTLEPFAEFSAEEAQIRRYLDGGDIELSEEELKAKKQEGYEKALREFSDISTSKEKWRTILEKDTRLTARDKAERYYEILRSHQKTLDDYFAVMTDEEIQSLRDKIADIRSQYASDDDIFEEWDAEGLILLALEGQLNFALQLKEELEAFRKYIEDGEGDNPFKVSEAQERDQADIEVFRQMMKGQLYDVDGQKLETRCTDHKEDEKGWPKELTEKVREIDAYLAVRFSEVNHVNSEGQFGIDILNRPMRERLFIYYLIENEKMDSPDGLDAAASQCDYVPDLEVFQKKINAWYRFPLRAASKLRESKLGRNWKLLRRTIGATGDLDIGQVEKGLRLLDDPENGLALQIENYAAARQRNMMPGIPDVVKIRQKKLDFFVKQVTKLRDLKMAANEAGAKEEDARQPETKKGKAIQDALDQMRAVQTALEALRVADANVGKYAAEMAHPEKSITDGRLDVEKVTQDEIAGQETSVAGTVASATGYVGTVSNFGRTATNFLGVSRDLGFVSWNYGLEKTTRFV
ncbi:MAG: hypothetical protein K5989_10465, partial [Lachnospiraceae bacterium]|nr:hypothetical protein [Lachnospiraceae bacterium]